MTALSPKQLTSICEAKAGLQSRGRFCAAKRTVPQDGEPARLRLHSQVPVSAAGDTAMDADIVGLHTRSSEGFCSCGPCHGAAQPALSPGRGKPACLLLSWPPPAREVRESQEERDRAKYGDKVSKKQNSDAVLGCAVAAGAPFRFPHISVRN